MSQERFQMAITDDQIWIIDTSAGEGGTVLSRFSGQDRLMRATDELMRLAAPTPWPLSRRAADLSALLDQAWKIEGKLIELIAQDGERLKRATALRRKLEASLAALSATEAGQNAAGQGQGTPKVQRASEALRKAGLLS